MRLYFSTVIRSAPLKQSGDLVWLDWGARTVLGMVPIYPSNPELDDPNPRGNTRGGRGIVLFNGQVVVSSYHTLKLFDQFLCHQRDLSLPLMVGLHESCVDGNGCVWISATGIDAALQVDLVTGRMVRDLWPREMPSIQQRFKVEPLSIDKQADNRAKFLNTHGTRGKGHLHLNAVAMWEGEVYAVFSRFGAIVNLDRGDVVVEDPGFKTGHNLIIQDDGLAVVNGTANRTVRFYDLRMKALRQVIDLMQFPEVRKLARRNDLAYRVQAPLYRFNLIALAPSRAIFVRGLDLVGDLLFVGISPATLLCLDWRKGRLVDIYCHSSDVRVCVHGIKVAPS